MPATTRAAGSFALAGCSGGGENGNAVSSAGAHRGEIEIRKSDITRCPFANSTRTDSPDSAASEDTAAVSSLDLGAAKSHCVRHVRLTSPINTNERPEKTAKPSISNVDNTPDHSTNRRCRYASAASNFTAASASAVAIWGPMRSNLRRLRLVNGRRPFGIRPQVPSQPSSRNGKIQSPRCAQPAHAMRYGRRRCQALENTKTL
jgi:hypothetical protein